MYYVVRLKNIFTGSGEGEQIEPLEIILAALRVSGYKMVRSLSRLTVLPWAAMFWIC
jgi:hypothetical protein